MIKILFDGQPITSEAGDNLLQNLIQARVNPPYSCRSGLCHNCLLQSISGDIPAEAQKGLSESQCQQQLFLACQCHLHNDMEIRRPVITNKKIPAVICGLNRLNEEILELQLSPQTPISYLPGQHIELWHGPYLHRQYSLASVPALDSELHLHIQLRPNGQFSQWLDNSARTGDILQITEPQGSCHYNPGSGRNPMVLIGSRSGLSPLYGILRDALEQGHSAPITLIHKGAREQQLYKQNELELLASHHSNFHYRPIIGDTKKLQQTMLSTFSCSDRQRIQFYLCGSGKFVQNLRRDLLQHEVSESQIVSDSFFPSSNQKTQATS